MTAQQYGTVVSEEQKSWLGTTLVVFGDIYTRA